MDRATEAFNPSTGFGLELAHLNESGTTSRNESNASVEFPKADKEAEKKIL